MVRTLTLLLLATVVPLRAQHPRLTPANDGDRFVVDLNVSCQRKPDLTSDRLSKLPAGRSIYVTQKLEEDGTMWYFDISASGTCWVYGPNTAVWHKSDPDSLSLAILDHILARKDVTFDEYVEAENYLMEEPAWRSEAGRKKVSGLLQFRWLQLLDRALRSSELNAIPQSPLLRAWILSHGDLVDLFGPTEEWYVRDHFYWQLFEANKGAPWAEELAWFASTLPVQHDECFTECVLGGYVGAGYLSIGSAFPRVRISPIRTSLSPATDPAKQEILTRLTELKRKCPK